MSEREMLERAAAAKRLRDMTLPELWASHDAGWWIGQFCALFIALLLLREYSGPVAAAVGYALAVLIDIRENASRAAAALAPTAQGE